MTTDGIYVRDSIVRIAVQPQNDAGYPPTPFAGFPSRSMMNLDTGFAPSESEASLCMANC